MKFFKHSKLDLNLALKSKKLREYMPFLQKPDNIELSHKREEDKYSKLLESAHGNELKYELYNKRGVQRALQGAIGDAMDDFNAAISIDHLNPVAYKNRAFAELILDDKFNNKNKALGDLRKIIELEPEKEKTLQPTINKLLNEITELDIIFRLGKLKYDNNDWEACRETFSSYIEKKENNPEAYYYRAQTNFNLGNYIEAEEDCNAYVNLKNRSAFSKGRIKFLKSQIQMAENRNLLELIREGLTKYKKGDYDGALKNFDDYINRKPLNYKAVTYCNLDFETYYYIGCINDKLGNYNKALEAFQTVTMNPYYIKKWRSSSPNVLKKAAEMEHRIKECIEPKIKEITYKIKAFDLLEDGLHKFKSYDFIGAKQVYDNYFEQRKNGNFKFEDDNLDYKAYYCRATVNNHCENYKEALDDCNKACKLNFINKINLKILTNDIEKKLKNTPEHSVLRAKEFGIIM